MIKLHLTADTHGLPIKTTPCHVLIHAGDLLDQQTPEAFRQIISELSTLPAEKIIIVPGNHDFFIERHPHLVKTILEEEGEGKIALLIDAGVVHRGVQFWGSPYHHSQGHWAFKRPDQAQGSEDSLERHWRLIPADTDVLITHTPPKRVLDFANGRHYGSESLNIAKQRLHLKLHVFGHIHEQGGRMHLTDHLCINAARMNERGELRPEDIKLQFPNQ